MADLNRLQSATEVQLVSEFGEVQVYRNLSVINLGSTVKNSAGVLYGFSVFNVNNGARYLKIYDKANPPVVGTDTAKMTLVLPGALYFTEWFPLGLPFQFGIGVGATTGLADNTTQTPGVNQIILNLYYA